jgi:hypothetical protein
MNQIFIPKKTLNQLCSITADNEQLGTIVSIDDRIYDKILVRYDNHKDNTKCKLNDIVYDTVCFHTHPKACYEQFNTDKGWPSINDMISFASIDKIKVMFVLSIEGVYVSVKKNVHTKDLGEELYNFFKSISKDKNTIDEYLIKINECMRGKCVMYFIERGLENNMSISFS